MGLFWSYIKDTLRVPWLQTPGPLASLAEGGADCLDPARDHIMQLRDQFFPVRCENRFLTEFARSRGIIRSPLEPDSYWLERVRFAYHWWARGGRVSAMAESLVWGFGFGSVQVVSLRSEDPTRWASFRVETTGITGEFPVLFSQVQWAINEIKPARSKLSEIRSRVAVKADAPKIGAATSTRAVVSVGPPNFSGGTMYRAAATYSGETVRLLPLFPASPPSALSLSSTGTIYRAGAACIGETVRILPQ